MTARGIVHVHACPPALCPHVSWALGRVLGSRCDLSWAAQSVSAGSLRTECPWTGPPGTGGRLASTLRGWSSLRFEVTEEPSRGCDGQRYSWTPALGLFRTPTSANGDVMVGEDRLRSLLDSGMDLAAGMQLLLGTAWDEDLEPYRRVVEGQDRAWLTRVV